MTYQQFISIDPAIRFGRPCITGTRISVCDVLGWLGLGMGMGMSTSDLIEDFPELTEEQIRACLLYAADRERKIRVVV